MFNRFIKHILFLPGCMAGPLVQAATPQVASVVIEATAEQLPATDYPSDEACGWDPDLEIDVRVRAGETLDQFARWTDSSVQELADLNGLKIQDSLLPGQGLILILDESELDALEEARTQDAEAKLARFIVEQGGLAGIAAHQVKRGETAWQISKQQAHVPLWVLSAFNTDVDMDTLHSGDTLYLPVMGQTLGARFDAQAESAVGVSLAQD
jgi:hypothetical protein